MMGRGERTDRVTITPSVLELSRALDANLAALVGRADSTFRRNSWRRLEAR